MTSSIEERVRREVRCLGEVSARVTGVVGPLRLSVTRPTTTTKGYGLAPASLSRLGESIPKYTETSPLVAADSILKREQSTWRRGTLLKQSITCEDRRIRGQVPYMLGSGNCGQ